MINRMSRLTTLSKISSLKILSLDLIVFRMASLAGNFLMIPILMAQLGSKVLGLYYLLYALFCFFSLFDLGIGNGLIGIIAKSGSRQVGVISIISVKLLMQVGLFLLPVLIFAFYIMGKFGWLIGKYGAEESFGLSILLVLFSSFLNNVGNLSNKIRAGLGNYQFTTRFETLSVFLSICVTTLGLNLYPSLLTVVIGMIVFPSLISIINLLLLLHSFNGGLQVSTDLTEEPIPKAFDILRASRLYFLLQFTTVVGFQLDNLIVGLILNPIDVTNLAITWKIFSTPYILYTSLVAGLWAFSAKNLSGASSLNVRSYFIKSAINALLFSVPFTICFLILGPSILRIVAPSLESPTRGMLFTCIALLPIMCVCQPFAMILNGLHREKFLVITATSGVFLNIFFSVLFIRITGEPYGALLGSIFAQVLGFLVPVFIYIRRSDISSSPEAMDHF